MSSNQAKLLKSLEFKKNNPILTIYALVLFISQSFSQIYTQISSQNLTIQALAMNSQSPIITLKQQIVDCPFQKEYLISVYHLDYSFKSPIQFNISMSQKNNQVQFAKKTENYIAFQVAEICFENVYVQQVLIENPQFDSNNYYTYEEKPINFAQGMQAVAFLTGFVSQQQNELGLFLTQTVNIQTGFQFQFFAKTPGIQQINFNYIYFPSSYQNGYFQFTDFNDLQKDLTSSSPLNSGHGDRFSQISNIKNDKITLFGLNGFQTKTNVRSSVLYNQTLNQFQYRTWFDSTLEGVGSQFLQFQMINCQLNNTNKQINYNNSCIDKCPGGFYKAFDSSMNVYLCLQCSKNCMLCSDKNICLSCNEQTPYLYNSNCYLSQPLQTYCQQVENYYQCQKCPNNCNNYCDSSFICQPCPNGQSQINSTCQCDFSTGLNRYGVCLPCLVQGCLNCAKDYQSCQQCHDQAPYYYNNQCNNSQPPNTYCEQVNNYFLCQKCSTNCPYYCDSSSRCLSCPNGQFNVKGQNCQCNPTTGLNLYGVCIPCQGQGCQNCSDSYQICQSCQEKSPYLYNNKCSSTQPQNTYCQQVENYFICQKCQFNCFNYCDSNQNCSECPTGYTKINSTCECNQQTGLNENGICTACKDQNCQSCSNNYQICEKCQDGFKISNENSCICQNSSFFYNEQLRKCIEIKYCQIAQPFQQTCQLCQPGFFLKNGQCSFCGQGKYADLSNNCNSDCPQNCQICTNNTTCIKYYQDIPCHISCSDCNIPASPNSCITCISNTRFLNKTTSSCDCIAGYEETGKVDCQKISENESNSYKSFLKNYFYASFYTQMPFVFLPFYTHAQYSFTLQQQIGILGLLQDQNEKNIRIQTLNYYSIYNFYNQNEENLSQQLNNFISYSQTFSIILFTICIATFILKFILKASSQPLLQVVKENGFITFGRFLSTFSIFLIIYLFSSLEELSKTQQTEGQFVFGNSSDFLIGLFDKYQCKHKLMSVTMNISQKRQLSYLIWVLFEFPYLHNKNMIPLNYSQAISQESLIKAQLVNSLNLTIQSFTLNTNSNNILTEQIIACPFQKSYLASVSHLDYSKKTQSQFNISVAQINNQVKLTNTNEYCVDVQVAEICLENVFVQQVLIQNPKFDSSNYYTYEEKPINFAQGMQAVAFLTGFVSQQQNELGLFLTQTVSIQTGFQFQFFAKTSGIQQINFNYIYFPSSYQNGYFQFKDFNDLQKDLTSSSPLNSGQGDRFSQINNIKNESLSIFGLNGFQTKTNVRSSVLYNQTLNQFKYRTWFDSTLEGVGSQFLQFQMINCQLNNTNKQINYNNSCIDKCPDGFYKAFDNSLKILRCLQCPNNCLLCKDEYTCLSCKDEFPYLFNNFCYIRQPQNTYCQKIFNNFICQQCQIDCPNYCDENQKCPYSQQQNNLSCECKAQTGLNKYGICTVCDDQNCQNCKNNYQICEQCYDGFKINDENFCVCQDSSSFYNSQFHKCFHIKNCLVAQPFQALCQICQPGFLKKNGQCQFCGNGKYADSNNNCYGTCPQNCSICTDSKICMKYDQDIPCHNTCSDCIIPGSPNSCLSCISDTRILNKTTNTCDCISGYEEKDQVSCQKIPDNVSSSYVNFLKYYFYASFYIQMPFIFLPFYTHAQYSFILQQQVGIIGLLQGTNEKNLRIQIIGLYSFYNFYNQNDEAINNQINTLVSYSQMFSIILFTSCLASFILKFALKNSNQSFMQLIFENGFITLGKFLSSFSIFLIIFLFSNLNELQKSEQTEQNNIIYTQPTLLDITQIALLTVWQTINILISILIYYNLLQQILKCQNMSYEQKKDFPELQMSNFPRELDQSTISQILSSPQTFKNSFLRKKL
ncbi:hypothetical protein ABPG74_002555 [Tetrahymena malaccensis]